MEAPAVARSRTRPVAGAAGTLVILAITAAIILAVVYLTDRKDTTTSDSGVTAVTVTGTATGAAPTVGQPAPEISAALADGTPVKLSDFKGHPVWLTFGASWCQPCRAENPDIVAASGKYADLVVLQVYMSEDASTVKDYTSRVGIPYRTVPDPAERLAAEYRILGIPSHFFIDRQGVLQQFKIGSLDPSGMDAAIAGIRQ
jgi:cytochrome c biogenesis protein CcmG, thiol:disulfide interchange protein DsbE